MRKDKPTIVSTHQADAGSSKDETDNDDDDEESAGSHESEGELWEIEKVHGVKYFNTKSRQGWHAFVDWKGNWDASYTTFGDLNDSSCKSFGLVELIVIKIRRRT